MTEKISVKRAERVDDRPVYPVPPARPVEDLIGEVQKGQKPPAGNR